MLVDSDLVWRGAPQTIDNTDGHHERYTNFETFTTRRESIGSVQRRASSARSGVAQPSYEESDCCLQWRNQGDIHSALRLEAGASLWRETMTGKDGCVAP